MADPVSRARAGAAAAGAVAAGLAGWALWVEPRRIVVRRETLRLLRWPARLAGLRVAVVSDLHAGAPHVKAGAVARVVEAIEAAEPDLVLLLGDYVDEHVRFATRVEPLVVARTLARLSPPLGVHAVLGNHDWVEGGRRVAWALREAGIGVLENDAAPAGPSLWLVGLAALGRRPIDVSGAFAPVPRGATVIAMTHSPDLFPRLPDSVALTVAGHTHGGQVNVPGLRARLVPSRYGTRFLAGHVEEDGRHLYVSTGVGTSGFPVRLGRPPEVTVLTLEPWG